MRFLVKPNQYSKTMQYMEAPNEWWDSLMANPPVIKAKDRCPLAIFGKPVADPELDMDTCLPRCIGANVESLYAFSMDYDSTITIEQFRDEHMNLRYSLYTSYSYGIKPGDRFRVIIPLAQPFPCELLTSRRVKDNIVWNWKGCDPTFADRGHWEILPARNPAGKYFFAKNPGEPWDFDLGCYRLWKQQEEEERARRMVELANRHDDASQERIRAWLVEQLANLEVGVGTRYNRVKSLLAWAMNNGLGDAVLSIDCPWPTDNKWQKRWSNLIEWAATLC